MRGKSFSFMCSCITSSIRVLPLLMERTGIRALARALTLPGVTPLVAAGSVGKAESSSKKPPTMPPSMVQSWMLEVPSSLILLPGEPVNRAWTMSSGLSRGCLCGSAKSFQVTRQQSKLVGLEFGLFPHFLHPDIPFGLAIRRRVVELVTAGAFGVVELSRGGEVCVRQLAFTRRAGGRSENSLRRSFTVRLGTGAPGLA